MKKDLKDFVWTIENVRKLAASMHDVVLNSGYSVLIGGNIITETPTVYNPAIILLPRWNSTSVDVPEVLAQRLQAIAGFTLMDVRYLPSRVVYHARLNKKETFGVFEMHIVKLALATTGELAST